MTNQPQAYRDNYEGRGKYATENQAMLDQERLRLDSWQGESTIYKPAIASRLFVGVALFLAVAVLGVVYHLVFR
jgi:hypothetical protein